LIDTGQANCSPKEFKYASDIYHASVYTISPGTTKIAVDKPVPYDDACSFVKVWSYKPDYVFPTAPAYI